MNCLGMLICLCLDDATVCPDDATVCPDDATQFFMFMCTFKQANGFQTPNPIQSMYNQASKSVIAWFYLGL